MAKEVTNNELGRMIKKGFDGMDKRFEEVDRHFNRIEGDLGEVKGDVSDIKQHLGTIENAFAMPAELRFQSGKRPLRR